MFHLAYREIGQRPKGGKEMKKYLGMYIIRPDFTEEQVDAVIEEINAVFTSRGGEILSVEKWGLRDLAYEINDEKKGYYVVVTISASSANGIGEFDRVAKINKNVLRHGIFKID